MAASYQSAARRRLDRQRAVLYLGVALFLALAALTFRAVYDAWQRAPALSRAAAFFELAGVETPIRPTGTPGAIAWLDLQIRGHQELASSLAAPGPRVPPAFAGLAQALTTTLEEAVRGRETTGGSVERLTAAERLRLGLAADAGANLLLRDQEVLRFRAETDDRDGDGDLLVMTRRRALRDPGSDAARASDGFLNSVAPLLAAARDRLPPLAESGLQPRVVRVYALAEDGTFVSLPLIEDPARGAEVVAAEARAFRKQPLQPSLVSNEFFFQFTFTPEERPTYSGFYLDLGGEGLVATLRAPLLVPAGGQRTVLAVDVAFGFPWRTLARAVAPPLAARLVHFAPPAAQWSPWAELRDAAASDGDSDSSGNSDGGAGPAPAALAATLRELAERDAAKVDLKAVYTGAAEPGALAAFQVTRDDWLLVFFPRPAPAFPWLAVSLLGLLGLLLLGGFEHFRRRAENELRERQSLFDTMQVPLAVVDPNTDRVVSGNQVAARLGIVPGSCIGDLVIDDDGGRARDHYHRMQRASAQPRRAYGVPLRVRRQDGGDGEEVRHAIVRSVAVAAPIASLEADQRHRLGILFLVDPDADLAIYRDQLERQARDRERRRLAGLLSHGVDTLARVLHQRLAHDGDGGGDPFNAWLAGYLSRRIAVAAWLLDHWHRRPPLAAAATVEAPQVAATLARFQQVFAVARRDPGLRARLHWSNGVLADDPRSANAGDDDVFDLRVDWPPRYLFTCPVDGGVGLFLEEVLVNAVKHGRPGSRPSVAVAHDPLRRTVRFTVENALRAGEPRRGDDDLEPYGGRRLLERLAFLFGWRALRAGVEDGRFRVDWQVPVSARSGDHETA